MMNWLGSLGGKTLSRAASLRHVVAVAWTVLRVAVRSRSWPRTVRNVLARQVLFTGFEAIRFVSVVAFMVGISVVVETQVWLTKMGQSGLLGPVLVMVVIREVGPLLTNFIVIGRSGTAIATELGNMKVNGETLVLDGQGLDPFAYLVLPRVLGVALSVFCLTIVFIVVSFISGYLCGLFLNAGGHQPSLFFSSVVGAIRPADVLNVLIKTWVPGLMTGAICCIEGLSVGAAVTEVPQAATRAVVRSITALFITSALVSLVTYL